MECADNETLVDLTRKHCADYLTVVCWKVYACPQLNDVSVETNIWVSTTPLYNPEEIRKMQDSQDC